MCIRDRYVAQQQASRIRIDIQGQVWADGRYLDMVVSWSACMSERGYSYGSSAEAVESSVVAGETAPFPRASADYECRRQIGYNELAQSVEVEYVQAWIDLHPEEHAALVAPVERIVAASLEILATS